jgi:hypothetical protein
MSLMKLGIRREESTGDEMRSVNFVQKIGSVV